MADLSNWTRAHPSGTSLARDFDDLYRSDKSLTEAAWKEEHYWKDGSAASGGGHKRGSARVHVGAASAVSTVADDGRLMWATDQNRLFYLSSASTLGFQPAMAVQTSSPSAAVHNHDPGASTVLRINASPAVDLTGISRGYDGRQITVTAVGSTVTIKHNDAGSTAGNKIFTPAGADYGLTLGKGVILWYDSANSAWRFGSP